MSGKSKYISKYKDLIVYNKAFEVSINIHKTSLNFPKIEQYGGLADQIRRSSKSVAANIVEGFAKQQGSKKEFKRFLMIALGSAQETTVWIEYCIRLDYIEEKTAQEWIACYDEIIRMLYGFYNKIKL
jgi:four helix bundle protein